jgi:hypothetical protein
MTTYTDFQPSTQQVSTFQPTLDGEVYVCTLTWNLFGQRYYINCSDLSGNLIFSLPLIGSPDGLAVEAITWDQSVVTVKTAVPHGYRAGVTVNLTLAQTEPSGYSGNFNMLVINDTELTFSLSSNPGICTAPGLLFDNINIAGGYFTTSTLVFRTSSSQFEVTP